MARSVPSSLSGGGGLSGPYQPGRFYGPAGMGGRALLTQPGLNLSPMILRPGTHSLSGIWAYTSQLPNTAAERPVRLGLWADDGAGMPGPLIKDCGSVTPTATGVVRCNFSPITLDGDRWVHIGAVTAGGSIAVMEPNNVASSAALTATYGDPLADYGICVAGPGWNQGLVIYTGLFASGPVPADALGNQPDLSGASARGFLVAGLIFGD